MKTRFSTLVVLVVFVALLMGGIASAQSNVVEIEFWGLLQGTQDEVLKQHIQRFNDLHDDIEVTYVNQGGYSELQQKLLASIAAGNTPAATMVDYLFVPFYAQNGVFEPLNGYLSEEDMADLIPGLLGDLTYDGQLYALPYNRSTQGLYYNLDLLEEVGIAAPAATWEEFADQARIIHEANPEYYAGYAYYNRWEFEPLILAWGGQINDEDCNVTLNSPEVIEALEFFQNLEQEGLLILPSALEGSIEEVNTDFVQGRVAYLVRSTSWLNRLGQAVSFNWDFAMVPAGPAGRFVTNGGANLAISARSSAEEKAAAWELIHYLTDTQQTGEFHVGTGYMPARYSALELPEVQALHAENPRFRVSIEQLDSAIATSCVARNITGFNTLTNEALQRVLINGEDAQTVFDQLTDELQAAIDELKSAGTLVN